MAFRMVIEKKALKFLASVPKRDYIKLQEHINELAEDPPPSRQRKNTRPHKYLQASFRRLPNIIYS